MRIFVTKNCVKIYWILDSLESRFLKYFSEWKLHLLLFIFEKFNEFKCLQGLFVCMKTIITFIQLISAAGRQLRLAQWRNHCALHPKVDGSNLAVGLTQDCKKSVRFVDCAVVTGGLVEVRASTHAEFLRTDSGGLVRKSEVHLVNVVPYGCALGKCSVLIPKTQPIEYRKLGISRTHTILLLFFVLFFRLRLTEKKK